MFQLRERLVVELSFISTRLLGRNAIAPIYSTALKITITPRYSEQAALFHYSSSSVREIGCALMPSRPARYRMGCPNVHPGDTGTPDERTRMYRNEYSVNTFFFSNLICTFNCRLYTTNRVVERPVDDDRPKRT